MSVRCFIAIELPADVRRVFRDACEVVRATDDTWRGEKWVPPENLHVTLKFVGHIAEESVPLLVRACAEECASVAPFTLEASGVRAVPSGRKARMLWGTFADPSGRAYELSAAAERAAIVVGAEPESRAFKPHVTLVRARSPHGLDARAIEEANGIVNGANPSVSVTAASVYRSRLSKNGPTYELLATCPLGG